MSRHEFKATMTFCIADAVQGEIDVTIHYDYTPAEKGCGHDAYRGPEPDHPAIVDVFGVRGGKHIWLPGEMLSAVAESDYIESLLIEHTEKA